MCGGGGRGECVRNAIKYNNPILIWCFTYTQILISERKEDEEEAKLDCFLKKTFSFILITLRGKRGTDGHYEIGKFRICRLLREIYAPFKITSGDLLFFNIYIKKYKKQVLTSISSTSGS